VAKNYCDFTFGLKTKLHQLNGWPLKSSWYKFFQCL
jgi:hypothetical protein